MRLVISCTPISSWLVSIRVSAIVTIVQVYAPTSMHGDNEVEKFYQQIVEIIKAAPKKGPPRCP